MGIYNYRTQYCHILFVTIEVKIKITYICTSHKTLLLGSCNVNIKIDALDSGQRLDSACITSNGRQDSNSSDLTEREEHLSMDLILQARTTRWYSSHSHKVHNTYVYCALYLQS